MRRRLWIAAALAAIGVPGWYALVLHSPAPSADFPLDLARLRALGDSVAGSRPVDVRYENVLGITFPEAATIAGGAWRSTTMEIYAYQLVFPDGTIVVDTAQDRASARPAALIPHFDDAAAQRVASAMESAAQIVITHEHVDHMGGIVAHPNLRKLLPALRLTAEQAGNRNGLSVVPLPEAVAKDYQPLRYDDLLAIAPGVVLIKAPGHTPGSQMVYVRREDGRELLFLGDASWKRRNVDEVRERPLFVTALIGENRGQVLAQFKALHALAQAEPALALVPGHDGPAVTALAERGFLQAGFQLAGSVK